MTGKEIETKLNSELVNVHKWLLAHKLTRNVNKTEYKIIGSRQRLAKITDDVKIDVGDRCTASYINEKTSSYN